MFTRSLALALLAAVLLFGIGRPAQAADCEGPYRKRVADGRCVWSCGRGTTPEPATNSCVCSPGLTEKRKDASGRRICTASIARPKPLPDIPAFEDSDAATRPFPTNFAKDHPFGTRQHVNCNTYLKSENDSPVPYLCRTTYARPVLFTMLRPHEITVRKSRPLQADLRREGRFRVWFPRPSNPRPNPLCSERDIGIRGACVPECQRLEYLTYFDSGQMRGIARPTGNQPDTCDRDFTGKVELYRPSFALAYDACAREAMRRGRHNWDFETSIVIPRRMSASYGFENAITSRSDNGWEFHARVQHVFVEDEVKIAVKVSCR